MEEERGECPSGNQKKRELRVKKRAIEIK